MSILQKSTKFGNLEAKYKGERTASCKKGLVPLWGKYVLDSTQQWVVHGLASLYQA